VTGQSALLADASLRAETARYLTDLTGNPVNADLAGGRGPSYGETAAELIIALVGQDEPVDRLLLAFDAHDSLPGRATATYLSHVCPGVPMAFAIGDQGPAAAFTALRIAGAGGRALVLIVEPASLPYPSTATLATEHRAVALLFSPSDSDTDDIAGWTEPSVPVSAVPARAVTAVAALSAGHPGIRVMLGNGLATAWPDHPKRYDRAAVGQPMTGVWSALVDSFDGPHATKPALLADYDPDLGYLSAVAIRPAQGLRRRS
jgi:hypothetical protein